MLEEAPTAVWPCPVGVNLQQHWASLGWDLSAEVWSRTVGDLQVNVKKFYVDWFEIDRNFKVEPFKAEVEPGVEVAVKLHVGVEFNRGGLVGLGGEVFAQSPVPSALEVENNAGLPVVNEGNAREGIIVIFDVDVWENVTVAEVK
jgi:hypothetical protein